MKIIKAILFCLFIFFFSFIIISFIKIKNREVFDQKIILAQEIRKALEHLMFDLRQAHESSILDLPSDGLWHHRIAFFQGKQGVLEYILKDGRLFRVNSLSTELIANNIGDVRIRRQQNSPDILEVQVKAQHNVTLDSNFKIRIDQ